MWAQYPSLKRSKTNHETPVLSVGFNTLHSIVSKKSLRKQRTQTVGFDGNDHMGDIQISRENTGSSSLLKALLRRKKPTADLSTVLPMMETPQESHNSMFNIVRHHTADTESADI